MVLIETPIFKNCIEEIATAEEFRLLQNEILINPEAGKVISGGGGARKIRLAVGSRGKSGGGRVIYYYKKNADEIYFLIAYAKSSADNLTKKQLNTLVDLIKDI